MDNEAGSFTVLGVKYRMPLLLLKVISVVFAVLSLLGIVGCSESVLGTGYVGCSQFQMCLCLPMFSAASLLTAHLIGEKSQDRRVLRRDARISLYLAVLCAVGAICYMCMQDVTKDYLPYGILMSGAIMSLLYLMFSRFGEMRKEIEEFV